ncbi:MAG: NAD-dependent epimerase/dehydratase family protein [Alphaproteobacteria bacterium]|nr:NAD-dependent epimerase/dehydratase family protein [Alphaproteobacteria bacterium]
MDLLIAGGTQFVGRHIVETALARGHKVTLLNRGQSGQGLFPGVERIQADRTVDVSPVKGRKFDSCIDVSGYFRRHVRMLAEAVKPTVRHFCFISTVSVYADWRPAPAVSEDFELAKTDTPDHELRDNKDYGALKALAEDAAHQIYGDGTLIIRPGLVVGPRDHTNRFTYWVTRLAEGGEVLAPGPAERPVQFIDARDLAAFTLHMVEKRAAGVYNATGPAKRLTMAEMLDAIGKTVASTAKLTWVDAEFLVEKEVKPYTEMPIWLPGSEKRPLFATISLDRSIPAGLKHRPLAETAKDTLAWWKGEKDPPVAAAMTREKERDLLAKWKARKK